MSLKDGMDVDRVREIARAVRELGDRVGTLADTGSRQAAVLEVAWVGPDATQFRADWDSAARQVHDCSGQLRAMASRMVDDADQQDAASRGGSGGSGPSPGTPGGSPSQHPGQGGSGGGPGTDDEGLIDKVDDVLDGLRKDGIDKLLGEDEKKAGNNPIAKYTKKLLPALGIIQAIKDFEDVKSRFWEEGVVNPKEAVRSWGGLGSELYGLAPHPLFQAAALAPTVLEARDDMLDKVDNDYLRWGLRQGAYHVPQLGPMISMYDAVPDQDIQIVPKDNLPGINDARRRAERLPVLGPYILIGL